MLISIFFSCALLLVQVAICSDLHQDPISDKEELTKKLIADTNLDTYGYNHPPVSESSGQEESRKGKSLNINEQAARRTPSRGIRRRRPTSSTPTLEIPVQVIYETVPTTVRSISVSPTSPSDVTTRVFVRRRKIQARTNKENNSKQTTPTTRNSGEITSKENMPTVTKKDESFVSTTELPKRSKGNYSKSNKKIDIRQTTPQTSNIAEVQVADIAPALSRKNESTQSATEFPKRSRDSYFQKRTGTPAPKVKILEETNFVYSHSGNFHYSFLGGDGTKISSEGSLKSYENNKTGEAVSGNVFYTDKDGNDYSLSYTADENGYRPIGAHLPTPPPLPPAIARALKYIADKSTQSPIAKNE